MKTNEPIKQFYAVAYDNKTYHFIITEENKIYCYEFFLETGADIIEIKPNFVLRNKDYETIYSLKDYLRNNPQKKKNIKILSENLTKEEMIKQQQNLISCYIIESSVLEYMIENKMILYSTDMALLYRLNPEYAYDKHYQTRSFKKNRHNQEKILTKQKKGIFH